MNIHLDILKRDSDGLDNLDRINDSYIDKAAVVDPSTIILPGTIIIGDVEIGKNNIIGPCAMIGTPAQHWDYYTKKIKSDKNIKIGDKNIIREFVTVHSPTQRDTLIGNNCFLMTQSHVSHDTILEDKVVLTNSVQIGGHSYIMEGATIGLNTCIHQYSTIGAYSMIGMSSTITKDVLPFLTYKNFKCYKINKVGLERNGFSDEEIQKISAYFNQQSKTDLESFFGDNEIILNVFNRFLKVRNSYRDIYDVSK